MRYRHVECLSMRCTVLAIAAIVLGACTDGATLPTAVTPKSSIGTVSPEQDLEFPPDSTAPSGSGYIVMLHDSVADVPAAIRKLAAAAGGHVLKPFLGVKGFLLSEVAPGAAMALASNPVVKLIEHDAVSLLASSRTAPATPAWCACDEIGVRVEFHRYDAPGAQSIAVARATEHIRYAIER